LEGEQSEWNHCNFNILVAGMSSSLLRCTSLFALDSRGPVWIGSGLCILVANALVPSVPVITGMALVAAGATAETTLRFRGRAGSLVVLLNLLAYAGLYALFVGAALDRGAVTSALRYSWLMSTDLALSVLPITAAIWQTWKALLRQLPNV
jgi:hypothetical protein